MHQFLSSVKSYTICIQIVYNLHSPKHVFSCDSFQNDLSGEVHLSGGEFPKPSNCIQIVYNLYTIGHFDMRVVYKLYTTWLLGRLYTNCIQSVVSLPFRAYNLYTICIQFVYNCIQITTPHTPLLVLHLIP